MLAVVLFNESFAELVDHHSWFVLRNIKMVLGVLLPLRKLEAYLFLALLVELILRQNVCNFLLVSCHGLRFFN
jgi:hypothetical protein